MRVHKETIYININKKALLSDTTQIVGVDADPLLLFLLNFSLVEEPMRKTNVIKFE